MKIGYAYERPESVFDGLGVDRVYIDTKRTERTERAHLFAPGVLRDGDTLVLRSRGDLGQGFGLAKFEQRLAEKGVSLEIVPIGRERGERGRPRKFTPDDAADAIIRPLWHNTAYTLAYVLRRARETMGHDVGRHQLRYRYGPRESKQD